MDIQAIADRLAELCHMADYDTAHRELYSENIVSIEPAENMTVTGMAAVKKKGAEWAAGIEVLSSQVSEPIVADRYISLAFHMMVRERESGKEYPMDELAVYHVDKNGKIDREQFFYDMDM